MKVTLPNGEMVQHPAHYGGADNPYEVIKVLRAWGLHRFAYLWNTVKYVARCEHKGNALEDLRKARFYLDAEIQLREEQLAQSQLDRT